MDGWLISTVIFVAVFLIYYLFMRRGHGGPGGHKNGGRGTGGCCH